MDANNAGSAAYFVPEVTSPSPSLQISMACIEEMSFEMITALKSVPRRGLEIGGILLGRWDPAEKRFSIEQSAPVQSEHLHGPSWLLSPRDHALFKETVDQLRSRPGDEAKPVGLYRSQTREGLDFDEQDQALTTEMFGDAPSICMVVKPSIRQPSSALIGMPEANALTPVATFPFHAGVLREDGFEIVDSAAKPAPDTVPDLEDPDRNSDTSPAPVEHQTEPPRRLATSAAPPPARKTLGSFREIPATAAFLLSIAAFFATGILVAHRNTSNADASLSQPATQSHPPVDGGIRLYVQRRNGSALLTWNHSSPAVEEAKYGILTILDDGRRQELRLSPTDLSNGRVAYTPQGQDLRFQMQLFAPSHSVTESIRSYADFSAAAPASPATHTITAPPARYSARGEARVITLPSAMPARTETVATTITPVNAPEPAPAVSAPPPAPAEEAKVEATRNVATPEPVSVSHPDTPGKKFLREPLVTTVYVEPVDRNGLKGIFNSLSPRHVLRSHSDNKFVPSRAVRQPHPQFPSQAVSEIHGEKEVKVKVTIDSGGDVVKTELVSGKSDEVIDSAVLRAARDWTFEPARMGNHAVESKAILSFLMRRP